MPVKQTIPCLAILSKKRENDIAEKLKSYLNKNPNDLEEGKEERPAGHVGVFCQNLSITHTAYTLENYSNFKSNFSFNNGSILEIHDYFRTRGNVCFNNFNLPQLINTLPNQDFTGFGNFNKLENLILHVGGCKEVELVQLQEKKIVEKRFFNIGYLI